MEFYPWIVLIHIIGVLIFMAAHGVSIWMAIEIRRERDRTRIAALLDLSSASTSALYVGLLVLLISGIWAGIVGDWFRFGWVWLSLVILVVVTGVMYRVGTPFFRTLRAAVGTRSRFGPKDAPLPVPLADAEVAALAAQMPVEILMRVGFAGLLLIAWLMVVKPF